MSVNVLYAGPLPRWSEYRPELERALRDAGLEAHVSPEIAADKVDYIIYAPNGPVQDFTAFTRLKAVLSLWAGVEKIVGNDTLRVPLTRMVDDGLRQGMVEWVTGHVLRYHLGMDTHIHGQDGIWRQSPPPLARDRPVTILGLGALGTACGEALCGLGFPVTGWSRSQKDVAGIRCVSGDAGLRAALEAAQIVVLLLPDTPETENTLNARTLGWMPRGARLLNPGRGPLIDDDALLAALDDGQIAHATLDVFRTEPLPPEHPYWAHPHVTVTPHIASDTREDTAARLIAENIARSESGRPLLHVVDRDLGY